jgi:hypothetical protein
VAENRSKYENEGGKTRRMNEILIPLGYSTTELSGM